MLSYPHIHSSVGSLYSFLFKGDEHNLMYNRAQEPVLRGLCIWTQLFVMGFISLYSVWMWDIIMKTPLN